MRYNTIVGGIWLDTTPDAVSLSVLPLFHVMGMQGGMNGPLFTGSTIVLLPRWDRDAAALLSKQDIVDWSHGHMAAYKSPRLVSFVDSLPKSGTGKVQWRALQEREPAPR